MTVFSLESGSREALRLAILSRIMAILSVALFDNFVADYDTSASVRGDFRSQFDRLIWKVICFPPLHSNYVQSILNCNRKW
jgi:hypothetical protein